MRVIVSGFAALSLTAFFSVASLATPLAQTGARDEAYREWESIALGRADFYVSDPTLLPSRLALAAGQSGCRYKEDINDVPIRFLIVASRRLAMVFCSGPGGSHQVFDLSDLTKPLLMEFPYLAHPEGFGVTSRPGAITWKPDSGLFEAESGSDLCGSSAVRHTYRLASSGFVVIRIEATPDSCARNVWTTIWEAPRWSPPGQPRAR